MATPKIFRLFYHHTGKTLRCLASTRNIHKFVNVYTDTSTGIASLVLNRAPVNALNLQLLQELKSSLEALEQSNCCGIIITSAPGSTFCAGLDLHELRQTDPRYLREFWQALQCMWRTLYSIRTPTAVAINGHAPAGGCMLAISCDYRVIVQNNKIGLNETRLGLAVPSWVIESFVRVLPSRRAAERELTQGRLINSNEALKQGLVDAVVDNDQHAVEKCKEFLHSFKGLDTKSCADTKLLMRSEILANFEAEKNDDLERFLKNVQSQEMQQFLEQYLEQLRRKVK